MVLLKIQTGCSRTLHDHPLENTDPVITNLWSQRANNAPCHQLGFKSEVGLIKTGLKVSETKYYPVSLGGLLPDK